MGEIMHEEGNIKIRLIFSQKMVFFNQLPRKNNESQFSPESHRREHFHKRTLKYIILRENLYLASIKLM